MTFRSADLRFLVNEHGSSITFRSISTGAYNVSTGSVTNTNTDKTVKAYFGSYMLSETNGTSIVSGDRKIVLNPIDTSGVAIDEPEVDDLIIGQGDTVTIVGVQKILSAGTVVCYICQARE